MAEANGEVTTALVGLFLIVGSSLALYTALMPWWAALACDALGIYFLIPKKMLGASDYFLSVYHSVKQTTITVESEPEPEQEETDGSTE